MRSFRDLEVYAKTLECGVVIASSVRPAIPDFPELTGMVNCALSIPLWISEAHSLRFADKKKSILLLEWAMAGCNKMVVYLEEALGIYGPLPSTEKPKEKKGKGSLDPSLVDDLIKKYLDVRGKIFRLEKSWQKWDSEHA